MQFCLKSQLKSSVKLKARLAHRFYRSKPRALEASNDIERLNRTDPTLVAYGVKTACSTAFPGVVLGCADVWVIDNANSRPHHKIFEKSSISLKFMIYYK